MKTFILALTVVVLATSPALAKKRQKQLTQPEQQIAYQAYASADHNGYANSYAVYAFGQYQGADPDPFIRLQLLRDPPSIQQ